ncbi:predicted protein [Sclerotinia sclerotiorum 1980 UF-70]|uniref:Uncharacterized protein n=2 Tax=Sclerotinia sclerotiorum (strain ATCC 18683 / 1980 / Ss-1) TaxID=665079 RepID=A7F9H0_SCLS1|nr:predicted protein [Sclerotinia sclerotiorum 1980 UF-70]APA09230.1 hypothetical protein sscle_04g040000 [Sclerotinia sclerotiorum 1980 UF-70]EDO00381.1 predicted protein [Sclerotinia sclerotiorum 1980 UF-70]
MVDQKDELMKCDQIIPFNGSEVLPVENASQRSVCVAHAEPLVHRPAGAGIPRIDNNPLQLEPLVTHTKPLVFKPAVPEVIVEQSPTLQQPLTLQHLPITKQPSSTRPSYSNLRRIQRQYREHRRRRLLEKLERIKGNHGPGRVQPPKKSLGQSDVEEGDLRMELQEAERCVDWHEKTAAELLENVDLELESFDLVEAKLAVDVFISKIKERLDMENVRKLLIKEATLEEWKKWGKKLMDRADRADRERGGGKRKSEGEGEGNLVWRFGRDWGEAIDQACEAAVGKRPWIEAMIKSIEKAVEEENKRIIKERGSLIERAKDKVVRMGDKISRGLERQVEPVVDSDDISPDPTLAIDGAEAEDMDMDMGSPLDMSKKDTGGEVKHPKN